MPQTAFRYSATVGPAGKLELDLGLPSGTLVEVFVLSPLTEDFADLIEASASSTDFWNNPQDDEDWNHA